MEPTNAQPLRRLLTLALGTLRPPSGAWRITVAFVYGILCHLTFAAAVLAMMIAMFFGMSQSFGTVPGLWAIVANAALIVQFPLAHSLLLSPRGSRFLAKLAPHAFAPTLSTTTYAIIASVQLLALFALWTPSGIIWWQADGVAFAIICYCYGVSWLLLIWASYDAGAKHQASVSRYANGRPVQSYTPTHLRVFRPDNLVCSGLDARSTDPCGGPDRLLPACTTP